jgi:flavin-dependent dehydrogenase
MVPGRVMAIFPTHDGASCVLAARSATEWDGYRRAPEQGYLDALAAVPAFERRVLAGRRVSGFRGTADLPNWFRRAAGPGWALVGDAGLVKDPGPGRGMSDAFRQADRLAGAIDAGLRDHETLSVELEGYAAWRDATFGPVFDTTVELARYDEDLLEVPMRFLRHGQAVDAEHATLAEEELDLARRSAGPRRDASTEGTRKAARPRMRA